MPVMKYRTRTLTALSRLIPEIIYVMCGARGETSNRLMKALPQMKFVGFEPDTEECTRLSKIAPRGFTYINEAVGARNEQRTLFVTRNAACSSLLPPNHQLYDRFKDCAPDLEVVEQKLIEVVSLDTFLPTINIDNIDFLDLDTQGSELEILHGAEGFLSKGVVGVKCEVEFAPLYEAQPLFGDVDAFLRGLGFMLFDLSRSRYRRAEFPSYALTRGQLLFGNAFYVRDSAWFAKQSAKLPLFKLCLLAAHLGFHDYSLETLELLLAGGGGNLSREEYTALLSTREQYLADLKRGALWVDLLHKSETLGLRKPMKLFGLLATQLGDRLRKDRAMTEYNWED